MHKSKYLNNTIMYLLIIITCIFLLFPFLIMVSYSLRASKDIFALDISLIPKHPTFTAYKNAITNYKFSGYGFGTWARNSILVCGSATFIAIFFSAMLGYAISRFKFTGRKSLWFMIALTQTIPWVILLVPYYMQISKMGMINNLWVLMMTYSAILMPISAWMFINFFDQIPMDLEEAAKIDGCSHWGIFFKIIIPLSIPSISAISLVAFVTGWGDFLFSSTLLKKSELWTLPLALTSFKGEYFIQWAEIMAMSTIVTIPIVVLFVILQRYLVDMMAGGVKQ